MPIFFIKLDSLYCCKRHSSDDIKIQIIENMTLTLKYIKCKSKHSKNQNFYNFIIKGKLRLAYLD